MSRKTNFDAVSSMAVPAHAFIYTPTDSMDITDPNTGELCVVRRVTANSDGDLKVTYASGDAVIVPMIDGVPRSMQVKKIWETGTTVTGDVVCEY